MSSSSELELYHEPFDLERAPLDRPKGVDHDWGGDGTDLSRPVRAHVLEALRPNTAPYPAPVDKLVRLGDAREAKIVGRARAIHFGQEHVADLVRMARDRSLYTADGDTDEVWATLHALRALGRLDISGVVADLIPLFDLEDDWLNSELPEILGRTGAPALEPLRAYLADRTRWGYGHAGASDALEAITKQHPELREQVVAILSDMLREAEHYHEMAVTGAMGTLIELRATEALPLIRRAFELGQVDETMYGPWGAVLERLEIAPDADDPLLAESAQRFEERNEAMFPRQKREELLASLERLQEQRAQRSLPEAPARVARPMPRATQKTGQAKAHKHKNKRKMESASRKANRRKRK